MASPLARRRPEQTGDRAGCAAGDDDGTIIFVDLLWFERGIERLDMSGPVAVCGDIHGRLDLLDRLLCALPPGVPLVHCGDLVDRGPDSRGVLQRLIDVGARGVRGNHEEWPCEWLIGRDFDDQGRLVPQLDAFGRLLGEATLLSYGLDPRAPLPELVDSRGAVPAPHVVFLDRLPLALDLVVDGVHHWVIHAGVVDELGRPTRVGSDDPDDLDDARATWPADVDDVVPWLVRHHRDELLWTKTGAFDQRNVGRTVLFGHVPGRQPIDLGHCVALDTGAGTRWPDAALTAIVLPERRFLSVT
jgi:serine/threonine protein phosphatase 1